MNGDVAAKRFRPFSEPITGTLGHVKMGFCRNFYYCKYLRFDISCEQTNRLCPATAPFLPVSAPFLSPTCPLRRPSQCQVPNGSKQIDEPDATWVNLGQP